ncbi:hypothetical protein KP509_01G025900 [Ceratopteris richardii]|nr:hypothetical protein KP509_01G025900 [Ceratopteris richardii]
MQTSCIRISQLDLQFSHPMSAATLRVDCGSCSVSNVRLACPGPEWTQRMVSSASVLVVEGNGQCLVSSGGMLDPLSASTFTYMHSPVLPLYPLSTTFHCPGEET